MPLCTPTRYGAGRPWQSVDGPLPHPTPLLPLSVSLLSGRYPFRTGIANNGPNTRVPSTHCLMASMFKEANYTTFVAGKWELSQTSSALIRA